MTRDEGLVRAIDAAGGVRPLARALGVSQPAISNWKRVPADRVIAVEGVTGITRAALRPDLYPQDAIMVGSDAVPDTALPEIDPLDEARAQEYELIGALLWRAPTASTLRTLSELKGNSSEFGMAHFALAEAAIEAEQIGRAHV